MTKSLNESLLEDNPDSQAVEADLDDEQYVPEPPEDAQVIITEPEIISIGRGKRKKFVRSVPLEQR